MAEAAEIEQDTRGKGRKHLRYEHLWIRKKRKLQKDGGSAYATYKGEPRSAKQPLAITCRCRLGCAEKIPPNERKIVFDEFYKLKSHDAQNKYLYGLIRKRSVRRRKASRASTTKRDVTYSYCIRLKGKEVEVCKKTFCDVHSVGKRCIEVLCEKLKAGDLLVQDNRGRHQNRHTVPDYIKEQIREHIRSFPRRQSHYSRDDN